MELVVLSGKGGTGKTTIAISLAEDVVRIDCDVDAPDFYMFYEERDIEKSEFIGGKKAIIDEKLCVKCGKCETICRFATIENCKINFLWGRYGKAS